MDARDVLLRGLIDDAGLFPPARKSMVDAVRDHATARGGAESFMLGRFLCPVSRLDELADLQTEVPDIGAVLDGQAEEWLDAVRADLARVQAFDRRADISAIEVRLPAGAASPATVAGVVQALRDHAVDAAVPVFLEICTHDPQEIRDTVAAIASVSPRRPLAAKLRCGGVTADAFPSASPVAAFITQARRLGLPFKATAGLHHPFRTRDEQLAVLQHGFINLLAATALSETDVLAVIEEPNPEAFTADHSGIAWREQRADAAALEDARELFRCFGSCSLDEAVDDLRAHGILPIPAVL